MKRVFGKGVMTMIKKKRTAEDWAVDLTVYFVLLFLAIVMIVPFLNVIAKAFSADWAVNSGKVNIWPVGFQLDSIKFVLTDKSFLNSFGITVFVTVLGTLCNMIITVIAAYPLSKRELPGMKFTTLMFVFTMLFSGGMIPNYILMKDLHLLNNLAVLIIPSLISVYNMLLVKNYFESLPASVEESAMLDGAGNITILFKIVLPMSTPMLATIALFYAVSHWNNYMGPVVYISKQSLMPLQLYLRDIILEAENAIAEGGVVNVAGESIRAATIFASATPILMAYPFLQKYFIKGITVGSVKG